MTKSGKDDKADTIRRDAEGQFARTREGAKASGVASAKPTKITGSEDATAHKMPPGRKAPKSEWSLNFDVGERHKHTS
ncbi:hypothetical protein [Rhizobium sp. LC145]|uniref:hypothetical protein n=1 Tax=Rhizobium sp. LC145 TaxID=1120688 RepID=UPI00062A48F8|nr:hypothetical protein [Rhizobium sp. LC145]KKX30664.1 hypothetical protein YH62_14215 [Rhizobium sp. LC145]TKT59437.1 hypothetical protein FDR95_09905 [Rhizobiaceae bacterium LC148]